LNSNPKLLLVSQPTRGVDIGAIEFIHRKLVALRDAGCAVLLVSAELEEVTALSDRLLIMHEGRIVGEVDPKLGDRGRDRIVDDRRKHNQPRSKELVGKLLGISATGYNITLTDSFVSSEHLQCVKTVTYFGNDNKSNSRVCSDNQGLVYVIYDEITWSGKLQKNVLAVIQHFLPAEEYMKAFVLEKE
jgi:ABC-type multidrug transport system ATPase subunit